MQEFNLLIVDDDPFVCKYLTEKINWSSLGIHSVKYALNGLHALTVLSEKRYAIVISDVKMDALDGLELQKIVRKEYPWIRLIIFSGYDDVQAVRHALKNGAIDYLQKPIDDNELYALVKSVILELISANQSSGDKFVSNSETDFPDYYSDMFMVGNVKKSATDNFNHILKRVLSDGVTRRIVIIDCAEDSFLDTVREGFLKQLVSDKSLLHYVNNNRLVILTNAPVTTIQVAADTMLRGRNISAGISCPFTSYLEYDSAISEAEYATWRNFYESNCAITCFSSEIHPDKDVYSISPKTESLAHAIEAHLWDQVQILLYDFFNEMERSRPSISVVDLVSRRLEFYFEEARFNLSCAAEAESDKVISKNAHFRKFDLMRDYFSTVVQSMVNGAEISVKRIVLEAIRIIGQKLNQNISLVSISEDLFVNPSYLSRLFKENTGKTFTQYLTEQRIERAKILLENPSARISEVSKEVGYNDEKYFSRVFRNMVGVTPKEYCTVEKKVFKSHYPGNNNQE